MSRYHHLTIFEREKILRLKSQGYSCRLIAGALGRSVSSISRELLRNGGDYSPHEAQQSYLERRKRCVRPFLLQQQPELKKEVRYAIVWLWWSPEQIAHRFHLEGRLPSISTSTIYRAVHNGCLDPALAEQFRMGRRKQGKNKPPPRDDALSIHKRSEAANKRAELGHFEGDLMVMRHTKEYIFTCVDRRSRYLMSCPVASKDAGVVSATVSRLLESVPSTLRKSITFDCGSEFANMPGTARKLGMDAYYCDPGNPGQRGTNENTNGLLRQYFPKHSVTFPLTDESLRQFISLLNLRPRKCLGWRSPYEIFSDQLLHLT